MRKLARLFGFREERSVVAQRSRRQRSISQSQSGRVDLRVASKGKGAGMAAGGNKLHRGMRTLAIPEIDHEERIVLALDSSSIPRPTESGVFVTSRRAIDIEEERPSVAALVDAEAIEAVTLIVYGWENVQPGTLSWTFPSLRSALDAVRAMRNAVRWAVLLGEHSSPTDDVETAREQGRVLVEA